MEESTILINKFKNKLKNKKIKIILKLYKNINYFKSKIS
jgi:hypothetical protein